MISQKCPYCAHELGPFPEPRCPSCGQDLTPFLPQAEDPRYRLAQFHSTLLATTPHTWAIPAIVVLNGLVFVAMLLAGGHIMAPAGQLMLDWGANFGPKTLNGQWWRVVTCMFLHFGIVHIGFNMYVLWQIGHFVERLVGNVGLLVLYVASGIAASIASLWWNPAVLSAGASGAVFGVCGALLGFIIIRRDTIPGEVIRSMRSSLVTFILYNVAFGMIIPKIDMAAHLGGLGYGVLCGLVLSQPVTIASKDRRWQRNLLLAVGSAIVLPAAFMLLPAPPADTSALANEIHVLDRRATADFEEVSAKWSDKAITDKQFATAIRTQILPLWQKALTLNRAIVETTHAQKGSVPAAMHAYLTNRVNVLTAMASAVEETDHPHFAAIWAMWQKINQQRNQLWPSNGK